MDLVDHLLPSLVESEEESILKLLMLELISLEKYKAAYLKIVLEIQQPLLIMSETTLVMLPV